MLKRVLVANRGEIAVRIIRECIDNSVEAVAVYSTEDKNALHVALAAKAVCIGGPRPQNSYLNAGNIIEAAKATGCDAIHPGFGFLSENGDFADLCQENGLKFIGPSPQTIKLMGDKASARELMKKTGVPVIPGSEGIIENVGEAIDVSDAIGYPVLLKASAGGGGRGMRRADSKEEVSKLFFEASAEAESCFGDGSLYVEKLIENPRHIEFQILADDLGNIIHLGERDCSMQRRNQKILEEAPAWQLGDELRKAMGRAAVKAAEAAGYKGAGTVEFIVDKDDNFYFIEMNTRIQVEHPVTEMVTGINLVREQLRIASGLPLSIRQEDVKTDGHAIECRITAEKIYDGFAPCPGKISFLHLPAGHGVRVDSALYTGCEISPYYDSMVAKVIVKGDTRLEAIRKMRRALGEMIIEGVDTILPIQYLLMYNSDFMRGRYDTGFVSRHMEELLSIYEKAGGKDESVKQSV